MDDYVPKDDSVPPSRRIVEFVSKGFDLDLMLLTEVGACPEPIYAGICEA